jgi:exodeoxyribonuclease VII large subunit
MREVELSKQTPVLTLSELNSLIRGVVEIAFPETLWVIAEIAEARCNQKGHCYIELIEKEDDTVIAQMRANIWAYTYRTISQKFQQATGESIKHGMRVLFQVSVTFHEIYGLSLNIKDIDPTYSLGDMARKKREVIERLTKEGLIERNKALPLPLVPQRVAVVSSSTAAGYGDFVNHLEHNPYGYRFIHTLFVAFMQGEEAELSILNALSKIKEHFDEFDIAVIIRGGGSQIDLSCFDSYALASEVASFLLPVVTGIGHQRDDTVVDMVAHTKCKTPTDVAQFIISGVRSFEERILGNQARLVKSTEGLLKDTRHNLKSLIHDFRHRVNQMLSDAHRSIDAETHRLQSALRAFNVREVNTLLSCQRNLNIHMKQIWVRENGRIEKAEQAIRLLDPINVLKRGYSITFLDGTALRDATSVDEGMLLETRLYHGRFTSRVEEVRDEQPGDV